MTFSSAELFFLCAHGGAFETLLRMQRSGGFLSNLILSDGLRFSCGGNMGMNSVRTGRFPEDLLSNAKAKNRPQNALPK